MKTSGIYIGLLAVVVLSPLIHSCEEEFFDNCIEGNGVKRVENRILTEFNAIEVDGDYEVQIDTGRNYTAVITVDENLLDEIITTVSDGKLIVKTHDGVCIKPSHRIILKVTTQSLQNLGIYGSSSVYCDGLRSPTLSLGIWGSGAIHFNHVESPSTSLDLYGSGKIECNMITETITTKIAGSGKIVVEGIASTASHTIIGSGRLESEELITNDCFVEISGSGIAEVNADQSLHVVIAGSGIVYYLNDPQITKSISGSGKLIHR